ncbi:MAG: (d)CMP kinase [Actinomycetota bacterium]
MSAPRVVAIDGAAGSGKSTLSRGLARALGVPYINTGLMYRALTSAALRSSVDLEDQYALIDILGHLRFMVTGEQPPELEVEGYPAEALTTREVELTVSRVARHPRVREHMRRQQRALGVAGAVMEGRDIATAVFPDAPVKLFLRADEAERSARRARERASNDPREVARALRHRDERDARTNPLEPAPGAVVVDTGALDADAVLAQALLIVRPAWPKDAG